MSIAQQLRDAVKELRRKPMPLVDLIPLLQVAADELDERQGAHRPVPGDVFQINEFHGRKGWIGAFVLADEIKNWGIQGFVIKIETHDQHACQWIRLKWEEIDYIGHASLVPDDHPDANSIEGSS